MKLKIKNYCIRCGLCEDLHPELFKLNVEDDRVDILYDEIPAELEDEAKEAMRDCAITAMFIDDGKAEPEDPQLTEDTSCDVAVMGSGLAGVAAAITCARNGAKVMMFEKRPFQGGSVSNTPIGYSSTKPDPEYQAAAFHSIFNFTNFSGNAAVIRTWLANTHRAVELTEYIGSPLKLIEERPLELIGKSDGKNGGFPPATRTGDNYYFVPRGKGHGAAVVCYKGMLKLRELGGELYVDTPVTDVIMEDGVLKGIKVTSNRTGKEYTVKCKALIIASGGFGEDREMVKEYTGHTFTDINCSNGGNVLFNYFPGCRQTGDGHKLAWKAGGAKGAMGINGHNLVPGPHIIGNTPWITFNEIRTIQEQPYLWVNNNGERFIEEGESDNHMAMGTAIANQPGKCGYIVFDEDTRIRMETEGVDLLYFIFPVKVLTDVEKQFDELINVWHNEHVFMADTIEELCAQTGIDEAGLKATLEKYNTYCDNGFDEEFYKKKEYLLPVRRGKFYALRVFNGGYSTVGGIKINGKCEVVNDADKPIPGIYAAGDCAVGEIYGNPPTGGIGNANTAMGLGFAAADYALEYIK